MPRYTATTFEQLQASGAVTYVSWLIDNYGRAYAAGKLRDAAPEAGNVAIRRVLDTAERAVNAANKLELQQTAGSIGDRQIPVNPNLPSDCEYRYRVDVSWTDPATGNQVSRPTYVCTDVRLSLQDLIDNAQSEVEQGIRERGYEAKGFDSLSSSDIHYNVVSVERRG